MLTGLFSSEASLFSLSMDTLSLNFHLVFPLYMYMSVSAVLTRTGQFGLGLALITTSYNLIISLQIQLYFKLLEVRTSTYESGEEDTI